MINEGKEGVIFVIGIIGGDVKKLDDYLNEVDFLSGEMILKVVCNVVVVNEVNVKMGLICVMLIVGSVGVVFGVLMVVWDWFGLLYE